ncbi:hypothetical protein BS78_03G192600 [Paspalum vaginatum]|nr:hypothetical protein BS78_03G192600 [Paspalum vaginatum]
MHRSSSYYLQSSSASPGPSGTAGVMDVDHLPAYDPRSDAAKKEALDASRADLARTFVHLIPVVVVLCGLLLWSVSNTDVPEVGVLVQEGGGHKMIAHVRIMPQNRGSAAWSWKGSGGMLTATEDPDAIDKAHGTKKRVLRSEM